MTGDDFPLRIADLSFYPVKSCARIGLDRAEIRIEGLSDGIALDREWMLADLTGRFVSQRECPSLARVRATVDASGIVLEAPDVLPLHVAPPGERTRDVSIWRDTVGAFDAGDDAARWVSAVTGRELRLVRFDRSRHRLCNPAYAGETGAHTLFADGYPVLVIGAASLSALNQRLAARGHAPLSMARFRPNIVIDGLDPHDEDHIGTITVGSTTLRLVKPCTRCTVTTIDPETGESGEEPLAELARYRMDERLGGVTFGMNAVVESEGTIAVGDTGRASFRF